MNIKFNKTNRVRKTMIWHKDELRRDCKRFIVMVLLNNLVTCAGTHILNLDNSARDPDPSCSSRLQDQGSKFSNEWFCVWFAKLTKSMIYNKLKLRNYILKLLSTSIIKLDFFISVSMDT